MINDLITNLLTILNQIKVFHWNTKSYSEHKAFDFAYEELSDSIDDFLEVYMGTYGRVEKPNYKIILDNYVSNDNCSEVIDTYIDFLINKLPKILKSTDTELLNIRDEMLAVLNRVKYFLTLK
jgi:DNA-binding ferritin-like protein